MADVFSLLAGDSVDAAQSEKERLGSLILDSDLNSALEYVFNIIDIVSYLEVVRFSAQRADRWVWVLKGLTKDDDVVCHLAAGPKPIPTPPTPRTAKCQTWIFPR